MTQHTCLTIAHNIFMDREQRYALVKADDASVEIAGICVPVWLRRGKTSEPAQEVFCQYKICNYGDGIIVKDDGFEIQLASQKPKSRLRDIADAGAESILFSQHGEITIDNKQYRVIHFVSILDISLLHSTISS